MIRFYYTGQFCNTTFGAWMLIYIRTVGYFNSVYLPVTVATPHGHRICAWRVHVLDLLFIFETDL